MATLRLPFLVLLTVLRLVLPVASNEKPPADSQFSILRVTVGKDDFQTLQDKLGPTKKCHVSDHDGFDLAGYSDSAGTLVFEFAEIGGGDVTAFSLGPPTRAVACRLSPLRPEHLQLVTGGGVRLGMTEQEFRVLFGEPVTRNRSGNWKYDWTFDAKYTEDEKRAAIAAGHPVASDTYLVGVIVEARFANGVLQYFYISKTEST